MLPHKSIEARLQSAVSATLPGADVSSVLVRPCPDPKFGDYQTNVLMALAKERKLNPRQLATDVLAKLDVADVCEKVDIAGAGFLNFYLKVAALNDALQSAARGEHLFFEKTTQPRTVVIDFSSPNVAKPMHVGHIRSTILGDSLARTLRLLGHHVITDNHIGDWGTQFGMLIVGWKRLKASQPKKAAYIDDLVEIYKETQGVIRKEKSEQIRKYLIEFFENIEQKIEFEIKDQTKAEIYRQFGARIRALAEKGHNVDEVANEILADIKPEQLPVLSKTESESREQLVGLQNGDPENLAIWHEMIALSQVEFGTIYKRLGVTFDHAYGESFYNARLKAVVNELCEKSIARESEGAICVFSDGSLPPKQDPFLKQEDGEWKPNPCLIQKSDGAANYATTDLATLAFRLETWHPSEIVYVTDGRQQLHFQQIFQIFRRWHPEAKVKLAHVWFGSILGDDGKPFKTRSGETVKLADLLDEAQERALKVVSEKNPELLETQRKEIARVVGLGAIKYADLAPNRQSDYVFSWDKMLALNGNTAPYLQYAYARIRSIFRKAASETGAHVSTGHGIHASVSPLLSLAAPAELALARHLLNFGLVLEAVAAEYRPNFLCNYLYELAAHFGRFYENCPVLKAEPAERASRLVLCELSAHVLKSGLNLLGIETLEQM